MTLTQLLNLPCTIVRRSPGDERSLYGAPINVETTTETLCELQQRQRAESDDRGEVGTSDWLLVLPAGTDLRIGDAVIVDGVTFEVVGEPWKARNPRTGAQSHVEATLRRSASTGDPVGS